MNVDYTYILQAFLPELVLVAVALGVLAVDLLLPKHNTRRALTLLAALGCLVAAGMSANQWVTDDGMAPDSVRRHIVNLGGEFGQAAMGNASIDDWARLKAPVDGWSHTRDNDVAEWFFIHSKFGQDAPSNMTNADARNVLLAYQEARAEFPALPKAAIGLGDPGFAAWWLFSSDKYAAAFKFIFALAAFLVLLFTVRTPVEKYRGEFAGLLLFTTVGLMVMVSSLDLIGIFLGLELASLCLYALASWHKDDPRSAEAGTKYLLLGSLASAFFIYGASLLFVQFGSTHLSVLGSETFHATPLAIVALLMLVVGFGFKIAGAPFHLWAPDVYQGAPVAVAAFLSTASKAAGFAVLLRVLATGFLPISPQWASLLGVMAALSMLLGNLIAVHQNNVKRLLAYSGVAQAGYLLVALAAFGLAHKPQAMLTDNSMLGATAIVLYLFLYTVANIGAFAVVGLISRETGSEEMSGFAGLRERAPLLAFAMTLLLLSLGGIPLLSGFVGKWFLFLSGVQQGQYLLVLLGAALNVVSIYYYLLIIKQMYILPSPAGAAPVRTGALFGIGILAVVALTVIIGCYPGPFLALAEATAQSLR